MTRRRYIAQPAEKSSCPDCGQRPTLVIGVDGRGPAFYVCRCGFIGHVGVGPLQRNRNLREERGL